MIYVLQHAPEALVDLGSGAVFRRQAESRICGEVLLLLVTDEGLNGCKLTENRGSLISVEADAPLGAFCLGILDSG